MITVVGNPVASHLHHQQQYFEDSTCCTETVVCIFSVNRLNSREVFFIKARCTCLRTVFNNFKLFSEEDSGCDATPSTGLELNQEIDQKNQLSLSMYTFIRELHGHS